VAVQVGSTTADGLSSHERRLASQVAAYRRLLCGSGGRQAWRHRGATAF